MIDTLDHLVLTVKDIERSIGFYVNALGMKEITFKENRKALAFGNQKINLHKAGEEYEPKAQVPMPGSADLCFLTRMPMPNVMDRLNSCGIEIIEGPVEKTGAFGPILSVYVRDPDGNLIEISNAI